MLVIDNLTYSYDEIVYNFTCKIEKNEIIGIIGESGSGKSTLLDLIAGFLTPLDGNIVFEDNDITKTPTENRPITILFQKYNNFEHLSVLDNVILGINTSLKPHKDEIQKAKDIIKEVGLEGFENKLASSLSGGQAQRVALARSLIRQMPILLLDEPFTGLDFETREKMLKLVKNISKKRALYTIMVTHDLNDTKLISDRVYKVKNGQLCQA